MHKPDQKCFDLIEETAYALSGDVVALMLMAVQRDNFELSVNQAIKWYVLTYSKITINIYSPITGPVILLRGGLGAQKM
jgi:hypothetical protein